jgi:hypothetical protein
MMYAPNYGDKEASQNALGPIQCRDKCSYQSSVNGWSSDRGWATAVIWMFDLTAHSPTTDAEKGERATKLCAIPLWWLGCRQAFRLHFYGSHEIEITAERIRWSLPTQLIISNQFKRFGVHSNALLSFSSKNIYMLSSCMLLSTATGRIKPNWIEISPWISDRAWRGPFLLNVAMCHHHP